MRAVHWQVLQVDSGPIESYIKIKKRKFSMLPIQLESHWLLATSYALGLYASTLAVAYFLTRFPFVAGQTTGAQGRYGALDGFRGVLAVGVFVHHSFAAYGYFVTGRWEWSSSPVLNHLGQTTVALFFMITGFLFTLKSMSPTIDWKALYVSRFARLFPLYALIVCVLFVTVFVLSGGVLHESGAVLLREFLQWLAFVCFGRPDINALPMTWTLIAGVNWSLRYEIAFYIAAVPALYLLSRKFSSRALFPGSLALLVVVLVLRGVLRQESGHGLYATHFLGGIVAAYGYRQPRVSQLISSWFFRFCAGASIVILLFFENSYGYQSVIVTVLIFLAVVGGLSGFGLLHTRAALWLGDISYGIYLLHGLILWTTLSALKAAGSLESIDLVHYAGLMVCVGAAVVGLASLSYICLEKPVMERAGQWSRMRRAPRSLKAV